MLCEDTTPRRSSITARSCMNAVDSPWNCVVSSSCVSTPLVPAAASDAMASRARGRFADGVPPLGPPLALGVPGIPGGVILTPSMAMAAPVADIALIYNDKRKQGSIRGSKPAHATINRRSLRGGIIQFSLEPHATVQDSFPHGPISLSRFGSVHAPACLTIILYIYI